MSTCLELVKKIWIPWHLQNTFSPNPGQGKSSLQKWPVLQKHENSNKESLPNIMLCTHSSLWTLNYCHAFDSEVAIGCPWGSVVGIWQGHPPPSWALLAETELRQVLEQSKCLSVSPLCEETWEDGVAKWYSPSHGTGGDLEELNQCACISYL